MKKSVAGLLAVVFAASGLSAAQAAGDSADSASAGSKPCPARGNTDPVGHFTFANSIAPASLEPDTISASVDQLFLHPIYDTLLGEPPAGGLEPRLATEWTVSDDGTTITLTLRDDVTFHDGAPFDAAAVKANLEDRALDDSFNSSALASLQAVEVVDDHTVELTLDGNPIGLLGALTGPPGMMMSPGTLGDDSQRLNPTGGSGAFQLTGYTEGVSYEYKHIENYWDEGAYGFEDLTILVIDDSNARLNALLTNAADAGVTGNETMRTAEEGGLVTCWAPTTISRDIHFNTDRSEFASKEVRLALNHAIDREIITEVIYDNMCTASAQRFPSWHQIGSPNVGPDYYAYDPDLARDLLAQAGLENGFEFELYVPTQAQFIELAEVLQQMYGEVGITVTIVPSEYQANISGFRVDKTIDAMIQPIGTGEPVSYVHSLYLPNELNNPGSYSTPGIEEALERLTSATTAEAQSDAFTEIADLIAADPYPHVVICNNSSAYAMSPRVGGMQIWASNVRHLRGITVD